MSWFLKAVLAVFLAWALVSATYLAFGKAKTFAAPHSSKVKPSYQPAKVVKPVKPPIKPLTLKKSLAVREYKSKPVQPYSRSFELDCKPYSRTEYLCRYD